MLKLNSIPTVIISSISLEIELVLPQMLVFSNMDTITFSSLCSFVFVQVIDAIQKWKSHLGCIFLFLPSLVEIVFPFGILQYFSRRNGESCWLYISYFIVFFLLCWPDILGSDWCVHVASCSYRHHRRNALFAVSQDQLISSVNVSSNRSYRDWSGIWSYDLSMFALMRQLHHVVFSPSFY